ncbi:DUF6492 family protein [Paenarthrobacter nicotinovorans]|uniref:DUF6492 family protein n=1 Tax=Paenarthrobacter nicotinovorans TaxID=29320 RepID=UPI00278468D5|nr:DUF6492 family protein [Paenarthrobacter nicotinovorans]MDP9934148.1 hypothetical protein [Paenarthrobacter nicotinovorans]
MNRLSLAIITPSYAPDFELCVELNSSVLRNTDHDVEHHIVVARRDLARFSPLANARTTIHDVREFLPPSMLSVPGVNMWVNPKRPFPPVRGWIAQQMVKLSAAASLKTEVALLIDSDVVMLRPFDAALFAPGAELPLFRVADGVDASLPGHRVWHSVARRLLGLPVVEALPLPDYVCCPCAWEPGIVRRMLNRVEKTTGLPWHIAIGRELHFSEMTLYGVFVDELCGTVAHTSDMHCVNHYEETPLDTQGYLKLLGTARPTDAAVMVSAKSGTPLHVRRQALERFGIQAG